MLARASHLCVLLGFFWARLGWHGLLVDSVHLFEKLGDVLIRVGGSRAVSLILEGQCIRPCCVVLGCSNTRMHQSWENGEQLSNWPHSDGLGFRPVQSVMLLCDTGTMLCSGNSLIYMLASGAAGSSEGCLSLGKLAAVEGLAPGPGLLQIFWIEGCIKRLVTSTTKEHRCPQESMEHPHAPEGRSDASQTSNHGVPMRSSSLCLTDLLQTNSFFRPFLML